MVASRPRTHHYNTCEKGACEYIEHQGVNMNLCIAKALAKHSGKPESPNHYSRLKALTGVETWDILDFVAGDDPDMWNLGKYWFRMGHKEGQSTLTEKKKMLKYLERSIEKEESSTE